MKKLDIVGIHGSLRKQSLNRMTLALAGESMPPDMALTVLEIRDVPFFDGDVMDQGYPKEVIALRDRIRRADGVVLTTPEYNFSIPGVLKNTLDWVSRGSDQPFALKPVALLTASTGPLGGARVQYDMRRVLLYVNAQVLAKPEVFIGFADTKFSPEGSCTDDLTRRFVVDQMVAFRKFIGAVNRMREPE
jgi:chromate reductase